MLTLVLCPDDNERPFSDIPLAPPSATPPPVLVGGAVFSPGNNESPFSDIPPPLPPLVVVTGVVDDCNDKPFKATPPPAKIDVVEDNGFNCDPPVDEGLSDDNSPPLDIRAPPPPPLGVSQATHLASPSLLVT